MPDALIAAQSLGRSFRQGTQSVAAVASASFSLQVGDRVALLGRSGSGKSTLLHLMAGLDAPSAGSIAWPALGPAEALLPEKIALVLQAPSLLEALTAGENIALPLLLMGRAAADVDQAVRDALALFGLAELAGKLPEELSGGQMQRVAIARAVAAGPRVLLADEPTGQLDQSTAHATLDALLAHLAGTGMALVVATHDLSIAKRLDKVWQMTRGRLGDTAPAAEAPS